MLRRSNPRPQSKFQIYNCQLNFFNAQKQSTSIHTKPMHCCFRQFVTGTQQCAFEIRVIASIGIVLRFQAERFVRFVSG